MQSRDRLSRGVPDEGALLGSERARRLICLFKLPGTKEHVGTAVSRGTPAARKFRVGNNSVVPTALHGLAF